MLIFASKHPRWVSLGTMALVLIFGTSVLRAISPAPRLHRNQIAFGGSAAHPIVLDASFPLTGRPVPALIVVHGGGWEAGDRRTYINPLLSLLEGSPYAWFSIDYRLAPADPYPAAVDDVREAVRWIHAHAAEFKVDAKRLALVGESSGGHLVSLVGALESDKLAGVVPFYGIHDFESWFAANGAVHRNAGQFLGVTAVDATTLPRIREASPVTHLHEGMPPYLLIHGETDPGVPLSQSQEMCEKMRARGLKCELFVVPGAGHGMETWEKTPEFRAWKAPFLAWLAKLFAR